MEPPRLRLERRAIVLGRVRAARPFGQREVAEGGDVARHHECGAIRQVDRGPFPPVGHEAAAGAVRQPQQVATRPAGGVEDQAARAGTGGVPDAE